MVDDFVWCFVVDVCVDYVGVSVLKMLLYCVFCVFCVLITVRYVSVVGLKYCVFHVSGWIILLSEFVKWGVCCAGICVCIVLRAV